MSTHNLCLEQKYEKYQRFLSENFQFFEMKFSIYLNRCVFVMDDLNSVDSAVKTPNQPIQYLGLLRYTSFLCSES